MLAWRGMARDSFHESVSHYFNRAAAHAKLEEGLERLAAFVRGL